MRETRVDGELRKLGKRSNEWIIPFRVNNSAYDFLILSITYSVGGASCPAPRKIL